MLLVVALAVAVVEGKRIVVVVVVVEVVVAVVVVVVVEVVTAVVVVAVRVVVEELPQTIYACCSLRGELAEVAV